MQLSVFVIVIHAIEMYDSVELYTKQMFLIYIDRWTQYWRETEKQLS